MRSFLRMAGISQKISTIDVVPLLARNIYMQGYEGGSRPTEFLVLLNRYVQQARELSALASPSNVIRVSSCDEAKPLLKILGYRVRDECGKNDTAVETADAERAFVTIDSGFPLPALEQTLQGGKAFEYPYPTTRVPIIFKESDWLSSGNKKDQHFSKDLIDTLLHDPVMARLYWSMSRLDPETRDVLQRTVGIRELMDDAAVLDFYGSYICVRSGHVIVPGGEAAAPAWKSLVGANPDSPRDFVKALLSKDMGWMAAYFDVLSRTSRAQQAHFTEGKRLRTFYDALRAADPNASATKGAFRPAPGLLLLVTRQQWDADGEPHVPGGVAVWKDILRQKSDSKLVRDWGKRANRLSTPEQLLQAMFALTRATTDSGPLQIYLMLGELDMRRSQQHRLGPETVKLLARKFELFSDQYRVFAEFPELSDASLELFLDVANSVDHIDNTPLRGNALGTLQANMGIWQILARQGQIPAARLNESWQGAIRPFAKIRNQAQVYEAAYASVSQVLQAATGKPRTSQNELIELLASPRQSSPDAKKVHDEVANAMRSVLDSQRLVSLDVIHGLGQGLQDKLQGKPGDPSLQSLADQLREFEMPRPIFKGSERSEWAAGIYNNSHTDAEMRADIGKVLASSSSHGQLEEALGQLASFQRDTLVGLNYAYYAPPGAQALHNNPLLVRSHDFSAETVGGIKAVWQAAHLFGEGSPAGGGAHLVGSLADLPYVLAEVEQDFIVPENVQALIWRELVPGLMTSAVLPRWWGVGGSELHAITLYQRTGEELISAAAQRPELREKVLVILADRMTPQRQERVERALRAGHADDALGQVTPADTLYLAAEFRLSSPESKDQWGPAGKELDTLAQSHADEIDWARLSRDFGVPHPTLAQTYTRELLNLAPVPAFAGYSSRLLAESWDSGNLYWARLADESGLSPEALNRLVPELTRRMVEKVFATDFEDWPALVRALHETGDEYRRTKVASVNAGGNSSAR
ncbi:MAG TPA: hypothetical protein VLL05_03485 [Terriglobales bacterium]|nr:hypothetical protein [Terriglobales bacterium]